MKAENEYKALQRLDYKAPDFTASDVDLNFDLADNYTVVTATVRYKRLTSDRKAPLRLDGEDLELKSVQLNGQAYPHRIEGKQLVIENVPDDFELTVENVIDPAANSTLMGLYKSNGVFCTQCEPQGFRRITYFLDRPDVLAKYKVTILAPEFGCAVMLSNGNLTAEGQKKGRRFCTWTDPFPKPSYLFALVAGTFDIISDSFTTKSGRKVQLYLYVDRGAYSRGLWAMECIKQAMAWDEKRFGLEYDLDNFKVVAVDFFNQGAMENKSLNVFNSIFVLVDQHTASDINYYNVQSVIGHEYFHNYTGDRVTLRDWFQLSLKESLTVFRDQEFSSDVGSRPLTRLRAIELIRSAQFAEDASPMAHPVRPERVMEMNNFYTVTIYDKGAEVIRMIHTLIGEENFKRGLSDYLHTFDGKAATIDDFVNCMAAAGKRDLKQFCRWYTQAGTPKVKASWQYDSSTAKLRLTLSQSTAPTPDGSPKDPFYIPIRISFLDQKGSNLAPEGMPSDGVIILHEASQQYEFSNLPSDVLPVLLRDFSAPVRLEAAYSAHDYRLMLQYCDDPFIRQDSALSLLNLYIKDNLKRAAAGDQLPVPQDLIEAFNYVLSSNQVDPMLISMIVKIPPLQNLMQTMENIDLDALAKLRSFVENTCACALEMPLHDLYMRTAVTGRGSYNEKDAALRAARNAALHLLAVAYKAGGKVSLADNLVLQHYEKAKCMTDRLAAFTVGVHLELPCADKLKEDFEDKFGDDPLVFDNFFRVMATIPSEETVFTVRKLLKHKAYDRLNPNRVRALIGSLAQANPIALHRKDGTGYLLISDMVKDLDKSNPMVASKLVGPLLSFKRLDLKRQELARECLNDLLHTKGLSPDVFEKVNAALKA